MKRFFYKWRFLLLGIGLLVLGIFWPLVAKTYAFEMMVDMRQAIRTDSGGRLIVLGIWQAILLSVSSISLYLGMEFLFEILERQFQSVKEWHGFGIFTGFFILLSASSRGFQFPMEVVSNGIGLILVLVLIEFARVSHRSHLPKVLLALQIFVMVQWLNVMPFSRVHVFGNGDLSVSIKLASNYLSNREAFAAVGAFFMIPLMLSSGMTVMIFRLNQGKMQAERKSYEQAIAYKSMQNSLMQNRVYQEINSFAHDLKTPLSTIRGLSSLLSLTKDVSKLESYGNRIDESVVKMSDMISGFLYEDVKERISMADLISYIRAQLPIEDRQIHFFFELAPGLPKVLVNRIRMSRALINLIENAILAPLSDGLEEKIVWIRVFQDGGMVTVAIQDNGSGIAPSEIGKIWQIGYSTKNTSGLGLPFAKQTIEENGGSIAVESRLGEGTIMTVQIPVCKEERDGKEEPHHDH